MTPCWSILQAAVIAGLAFAVDLPSVVASAAAPEIESREANKPHRLVVLTDIGAEVDDTESMVRLLL